MAPDEMDQDHRQKSGREELEDALQDQIRAKEQEIRELREEIRAKEQEIRELREEIRAKEQEVNGEIRELRGEIRVKEEEIRGVEKEIAIASGTEVRKRLEAKLQFLQQQIISREQQISSRDQQISSRDQQISKLRQEISSLRQEIINRDQQISSLRQELSSLRSVREAPASAGLPPGVSEKLLQELTEFMALQNAKYKSKKSVQLSSVSQSIWDTLERQEGLKLMFAIIGSEHKHLSDLPAFGWDDRQERSQADRYIPHISKIAGGRKWTLIDAANNHPTLLSGCFGGWNFKGTTDVAFVHRVLLKSEPRRGLRGIFELKKDLRGGRDKAVIQTLICLVMANVFSHQFKPFAVLTDLDDYWSLYWMDGPTIYWSTFESRARAVGCIEELLQASDDDKMGTSEALAINARPHGEVVDLLFIKKRRMYEPPGMDKLKDLVGLIPDEEILDARVQLSVQQLQKLLHEPLFSSVPDVDVPWLHSMYC